MKELLNEVLEKIEDRLDLQHAAEVEKLHVDAMHYAEIPRIPLSIEFPADETFVRFPYTEVFKDPEKMLYNELVSLNDSVWNHVRLQDDYPLQIRPNYGVGLISSLFGAEIAVKDGMMPWVIHMKDESAFRKAIATGIPDLTGGLAGRVTEAYEVFQEYLKPYPKCTAAIHLTQPDMQGPFDNLDLLRGEDIFYDLYDDPQMVCEALDVISDTMIAYQQSLPKLNDRAGEDCYYIHRAIYGGNILLKLDTETAMLSEVMFEEFCRPYNQRVLEALGGGSIHFCGGGFDWHARQIPKHDIMSVNFGNPERQDLFTDWKDAMERKISVVGYGQMQSYSFIQDLLERGLRTGVTFLGWAENYEQAKRIYDNYREWWNTAVRPQEMSHEQI